MRFRITGSISHFDLELKFPAYIKDRLGLTVGEKTSVALRDPNIIIFRIR